jgi:LysM repeat protein
MLKSSVWLKVLLVVVVILAAAVPAAFAAPASQVAPAPATSTLAGIRSAPPPPPGSCTYRVRAGDTLANIAWRYHTSTSQMAAMNHIANPNRIYAGQVLRVPCARR